MTGYVVAIASGEAANHGFALTSSDPGWAEAPDVAASARYGLATRSYWNPARTGYLRVMYRTYP